MNALHVTADLILVALLSLTMLIAFIEGIMIGFKFGKLKSDSTHQQPTKQRLVRGRPPNCP